MPIGKSNLNDITTYKGVPRIKVSYGSLRVPGDMNQYWENTRLADRTEMAEL